uniref:Uncharacterized protein n=1 Tax=Tetranychus urticae TaxID=32264 RepID=T1K6C9_TETUR
MCSSWGPLLDRLNIFPSVQLVTPALVSYIRVGHAPQPPFIKDEKPVKIQILTRSQKQLLPQYTISPLTLTNHDLTWRVNVSHVGPAPPPLSLRKAWKYSDFDKSKTDTAPNHVSSLNLTIINESVTAVTNSWSLAADSAKQLALKGKRSSDGGAYATARNPFHRHHPRTVLRLYAIGPLSGTHNSTQPLPAGNSRLICIILTLLTEFHKTKLRWTKFSHLGFRAVCTTIGVASGVHYCYMYFDMNESQAVSIQKSVLSTCLTLHKQSQRDALTNRSFTHYHEHVQPFDEPCRTGYNYGGVPQAPPTLVTEISPQGLTLPYQRVMRVSLGNLKQTILINN